MKSNRSSVKRKDSWDLELSLAAGRAMTRDGRIVLELKEHIIDDGAFIIIGDVSMKPIRKYRSGESIITEKRCWFHRGGFGSHGGDDLVNHPSALLWSKANVI